MLDDQGNNNSVFKKTCSNWFKVYFSLLYIYIVVNKYKFYDSIQPTNFEFTQNIMRLKIILCPNNYQTSQSLICSLLNEIECYNSIIAKVFYFFIFLHNIFLNF